MCPTSDDAMSMKKVLQWRADCGEGKSFEPLPASFEKNLTLILCFDIKKHTMSTYVTY